MKTLQKNKQAVMTNGTQKLSKNNKPSNIKKTQVADMVFSEYEVWPILSELYKQKN